MRIDKTTIVILICFFVPLIISLLVANFDINKQISIQILKDEIDSLLIQASYYDNLNQFEKSIEEYNKILNMISYEDFPYEYATTQQKIGDSYRNLAELKDNEMNLENAINAYNEALKFFTIEKYPIEYADIQNNRGDSYRNLAEFKDNETNLENAINAYKEALKFFTIEKYPIDYAFTNINIGDSYRDLAKLQETNMKKSDYNFKSYSAYGDSLIIITAENYPEEYLYVIENRQNVLQVTYKVSSADPMNFGGFSPVVI